MLKLLYSLPDWSLSELSVVAENEVHGLEWNFQARKHNNFSYIKLRGMAELGDNFLLVCLPVTLFTLYIVIWITETIKLSKILTAAALTWLSNQDACCFQQQHLASNAPSKANQDSYPLVYSLKSHSIRWHKILLRILKWMRLTFFTEGHFFGYRWHHDSS